MNINLHIAASIILSVSLKMRFLFYVSDLYSDLIKDSANLLWNQAGKEERYALDLEAVLININPGHNEELMGMCKTLRDYSEYTERVRKYAEEESIDKAVERAITECIKRRDFVGVLE